MISASRYTYLKLASVAILLVAFALAGSSFYMSAKALLAQHLLHRAWEYSIRTGDNAKPWQWADMNTVARLSFPRSDKSFVVLDSASGEAMAFGPGLVAGDPHSALKQTLAIGGHRDTHLAVLEHIDTNEPVELQTPDGLTHKYRLSYKRIVDSSKDTISIATDSAGLVLMTCYPFKATQTGGPLRMVAVFTHEATL